MGSVFFFFTLSPCQNPPAMIETRRGQKAAEHCSPLAHIVSLTNWLCSPVCSLTRLTYAPSVLLPLLLSLSPPLVHPSPGTTLSPASRLSLSALDRADLGTSPVVFGLSRQI